MLNMPKAKDKNAIPGIATASHVRQSKILRNVTRPKEVPEPEECPWDGYDLLRDLEAVYKEVAASDVSDKSKYLVKWIFDALISGADPLLGLLSKKTIKKGRTLLKKKRLAAFYYAMKQTTPASRLRGDRGAKMEEVLPKVLKVSNKSRATVHAALSLFPNESSRTQRRKRASYAKGAHRRSPA